MKRRLPEFLALLILAIAAPPPVVAAEGSAASPASISVGDATFHTQVQWDPATRKCHIRWATAPAAALSFTQRWFAGEATAIADLQAQPPQKLSEHEITWVEKSKSRRVRLEYSLRAEDAIVCRVRVVQQGKRPLTLRWQQEIEGFPAGGTLFAPSPEGLHPLDRQDVNVGYRDGAEQLSIPMATWFEGKADVGLTVAAHLAMPTAGFRVQTDAQHRGRSCCSRRLPNLEPGQAWTVRPLFRPPRGRLAAGAGLGPPRSFPASSCCKTRDSISTHGCFTYSHEADEKLCDEFAREGLRNLEIHFTYSHLGKYFPDEEPWIKAIDDKWSVVKKTTDPAAPEGRRAV